MRRHIGCSCLVVATVLLATGCASRKIASVPSTALLNRALMPLYQDVVSGKPEDAIVGRTLDLSLALCFCSEKSILFEDTRIIVDEDTKYYLIRWKFDPTVVKAMLGKKDVQCRVKGIVEEVVRGEITPGMPYVVARLESVALQPKH